VFVSEILTDCLWRWLPEGLREAASEKIKLAQSRAQLPLPSSDVVVCCFSDKTQKSFESRRAKWPPGHQIEISSAQVKERGALTTARPRCSVITTCLNERDTVERWLDSLADQTVPPDQVVICDGGSSDGTPGHISFWYSQRIGKPPFPLLLFTEPGANIAEGRNSAARRASHEVMLFTDMGCELMPTWVERMLYPFSTIPECELVMGWYEALASSAFTRAVCRFVVCRLESVDPRTFLPSARSLGIKKGVFEQTGGFPAFLTLAGEDSLFSLYARSLASKAAFVPDAVVRWHMPGGVGAIWRMISRYAAGDAESGRLFWGYYLELLKKWLFVCVEGVLGLGLFFFYFIFGLGLFALVGAVILASAIYRLIRAIGAYKPFFGVRLLDGCLNSCAVAVMISAQASGFIRGYLRRPKIELKRLELAIGGHAVVYCGSSPETDEMNRSLAKRVLEYLRDRFFVTLICDSRCAKGHCPRREWIHPFLERHCVDCFDFEKWSLRHSAQLAQKKRRFLFVDLAQNKQSEDFYQNFKPLGAVKLTTEQEER